MTRTTDNLKAAFAGESQANRKYLAFAKKAEQDELPQVARLFKAAAMAETVHALNHINVIGDVKSSLENLKAAVSGETFEFNEMYPKYIEIAKEEGDKQAVWSFDVANKVEQIHAGLFSKAIEALDAKKALPDTTYYVCGVCGNTVENEAPDKCPICGAVKEKFQKIQ